MDEIILVVEENTTILDLIKEILEKNDYKVETALNGKEALKKLERFDSKLPDLIISDILMPEMNGYELLKEISSKPFLSHIPFIFLTGLSKPDEIRLGKLLGADDYILKPFEEKDLLASIEGKLKRYRRAHKLNEKLRKLLKYRDLNNKSSITEKEEELILFIMSWNETFGSKLIEYYPKKQIQNRSLEELSFQFFQAFKAITGGAININDPQGILVNIENVNKKGFFYFYTEEHDGGKTSELILIGALASNISYLHSLELKRIFNSLSKLDSRSNYHEIMKTYYSKILSILSKDSI